MGVEEGLTREMSGEFGCRGPANRQSTNDEALLAQLFSFVDLPRYLNIIYHLIQIMAYRYLKIPHYTMHQKSSDLPSIGLQLVNIRFCFQKYNTVTVAKIN